MTKAALAKKIYDISHIEGEFLLRSGVTSDEYFDKYLFESNPEILRAVSLAMNDLIPQEAELLAGLEMGGIPMVTMLSQISGIPALFVRKKAKAYGTCRLAEGGEVTGKTLVIIEDVVTSGGQILLSAAALRELGANISAVLCVIDRESGGSQKLSDSGLTLRSLFTMSELKRAALGKS